MPGINIDSLVKLAELHHRAHTDDSIEIDDAGWMHGTDVSILQSQRTTRLVTPRPVNGDSHVEGIVAHWTDTRGVGAEALAKRIQALPKPGERAASWHACIDATGKLVQSVSAEAGSWHAGSDTAALFVRDATGTWTVSKLKGYGANRWTWGLEMECIGELRLLPTPPKLQGKYGETCWVGWPFKWGSEHGNPAVAPEAEVFVTGPKKGLHKFTEAQVKTALRMYAALIRTYSLRRENCSWGHNLIDPQRRTDPGPLWMSKGGHLEQILNQIYQGA